MMPIDPELVMFPNSYNFDYFSCDLIFQEKLKLWNLLDFY